MSMINSLWIYLKKRKFQDVGNFDAVCPYCNESLEKKPARKKKCPNCGNFIFVRTRPKDEKKILVRENQIEIIEEQWSIVRGTHAEFIKNKQTTENERKTLRARFGHEPGENDIKWSLLNKELIAHTKNADWGLYRNTKSEMVEILRKQSKLSQALEIVLEVVYIDINGPRNSGGKSPFGRETAWSSTSLGSAKILIKNLNLDKKGIKSLFDKNAEQNFINLQLPVNPEIAWNKIEKELFGIGGG